MALIDKLKEIQDAERVRHLERVNSLQLVAGDFEGSVTGTWVKLADNGAGIVSYNNKEYVTKPIGFTSITAGKTVQLSHANGVYFSSW